MRGTVRVPVKVLVNVLMLPAGMWNGPGMLLVRYTPCTPGTVWCITSQAVRRCAQKTVALESCGVRGTVGPALSVAQNGQPGTCTTALGNGREQRVPGNGPCP